MKLSATISLIVFFSLLQYTRERQIKQQRITETNTPKVVEARGDQVPQEKMAPPRVVPVKYVKKITAGKPKVVNLVSNLHIILHPRD